MAANIDVKDSTGVKKFLTGNTVFKVTHGPENHIYGMVTTKEEYEKKLSSHEYIAILHVAPLTYKLAYLYGCLNRERGNARAEPFTFWHRAIGTQDWIEWFVVHPYCD